MGTVNMEDVMVVLILLAFAYMRGFENGKRSYNSKIADVQDAFRSGYNLGYIQGIEAESETQWKN